MNKSVIYIDTEDDITSIIDKVKASTSDIVALVPPKRIGVLQSIVNLKLLQRGATNAKKRIVLITSDQSLKSLAGGISIPTAKNLQSRPEVATPASSGDTEEEDVIRGDELSVGEMSKAMSDEELPVDMPKPDFSEESASPAPTAPAGSASANKLTKKPNASLKVPDFMKFRKRLFIGGGIALVLLVFLWWALWIAPKATVAITAKTEPVSVDRPLTVSPSAGQDDVKNNTVKPTTQQVKKTTSTEFTATGEKTVGDKANGTAVIYNCDSTDSITIPAGTALSAKGLNFLTASSVTVPGLEVENYPTIDCGTSSVKINAQDIGEEYNVPGGTQFAVAGYDNDVYGKTENGTSGGSERDVTIIAASDVEAAKKEALKQNDDNAIKKELTNRFGGDYYIINKSFEANIGSASSNPGVGEEADSATLTVETTYSIKAVSKKDINAVLDNAINDEISDEEKKIYDNGLEDLKVTEYQSLDGGKATMRIKATGYVGAKVDQKQMKAEMVGRPSGEIRELVEDRLPNVEKVNVKFSPFWVSSVSDKEDIEIKFEIKKNE